MLSLPIKEEDFSVLKAIVTLASETAVNEKGGYWKSSLRWSLWVKLTLLVLTRLVTVATKYWLTLSADALLMALVLQGQGFCTDSSFPIPVDCFTLFKWASSDLTSTIGLPSAPFDWEGNSSNCFWLLRLQWQWTCDCSCAFRFKCFWFSRSQYSAAALLFYI